MIKAGEIIAFGGDSEQCAYKIEYIAEDLSFLTIIGDVNCLKTGKQYRLTISRKDGRVAGVGVVNKIEKLSEQNAPQFSENFKNKLVFYVNIVKPFKKEQKREFFRHECHVHARIEQKNEDSKAAFKVKGNECYYGHIVNISAGGARIVCDYRFSIHKTIDLTFELNGKKIVLSAVILEIVPIKSIKSAYKYSMRVKFLNVKSKIEQDIVSYIFSEYRKIKSKMDAMKK